ncbi:MAG: hypothetical protein LBF90_00790, partial [Prevotellaceae bacterium]|nr:hypothetical protein [Prevotellaceae bacterium]
MPSIPLFPPENAAFFTWQHNFMSNLTPRRVAYGVPDDEWVALTARQTTYVEKYALAENPETRTSAAIVARNDARKAFAGALRATIRRRLNFNPAVDDEARRSLGLTVYKTVRTPAAVAADAPAAECDTSVHGRVAIRFFPAGNVRKRGKP